MQEDDKAMKILRDKVDEVGYPVGNELMNQNNSQLHFPNSEDSVSSDESDDKGGIEVLDLKSPTTL